VLLNIPTGRPERTHDVNTPPEPPSGGHFTGVGRRGIVDRSPAVPGFGADRVAAFASFLAAVTICVLLNAIRALTDAMERTITAVAEIWRGD
jgi:hypothetical protein